MAYDPVTHRLIMFGGLSDTAASLDDTWAYDPAANAWTELHPNGHAALSPCRALDGIRPGEGTTGFVRRSGFRRQQS